MVCLSILYVSYLPRTLTRGYFELPLAWHHSPIIPIALSLQEATHTTGTPLKSVGGREKVSLSLMCVIAPIELPIGLMVAFIALTVYALLPVQITSIFNSITAVIMALPIMLLRFSAT